MIERAGDRCDERLKVHLDSNLPGEGFDDRVFDGISQAREVEYVLDWGPGPAILRRMCVASPAI